MWVYLKTETLPKKFALRQAFGPRCGKTEVQQSVEVCAVLLGVIHKYPVSIRWTIDFES